MKSNIFRYSFITLLSIFYFSKIANAQTIFGYTGANQTYTVPAGVYCIKVHMWGAGGGGGDNANSSTTTGGGGGYVTGTLNVTPGDVLTIVVGEGGKYGASAGPNNFSGANTFGGGGRAGSKSLSSYACDCAGSGGGRTAIIRNGIEIATAGGGGGGGESRSTGTRAGNGGAGGGLTGLEGGANSYTTIGAAGGKGGAPTIGGAAGTGAAGAASAGSQYLGGNGGFDNATGNNYRDGGGGGGGYYGGGGGAATGQSGGGGGGGSSYIGGLSGASTTAGNWQTQGQSTHSYNGGSGRGGNANSSGTHGRLVIEVPVIIDAGIGGTICNGETMSLSGSGGSAIYNLTTSGGSYPGEKWVNITTGPNGTGTVAWAQGNGTIGNGSGLLTNQSINLSAYIGQTLYLNAYDQYDDSWDGSVYNLSLGGTTVINNGGNSPNDGTDTDASGSWDASAAELETSEAFTVTGSGYSWSGGPIVSGGTTLTPVVNPTVNPTVYTLSVTAGGCTVTDNVTVNVNAPAGDPTVFGVNTWNVYGYTGQNIALTTGVNYYGYYVQNIDNAGVNYGFNTQDIANAGWANTGRPSNSSTWQGCILPQDDNFTFVHKRRGFPCGTYQLSMTDWDDETQVFVNNVSVWNCASWSGAGACTGTITGAYALDANSTIEVRTGEGVGGANARLEIVPVSSTALAINGDSRTCPVTGNQWVHFYTSPDARYLASVRGTTPATNLGNVTVTTYVDGTVDLVPACSDASYETAVMQRHWVINPTINGAANIRLPYTNTELTNLAAASATSSSPDDLVTTQATVFLSKYSGPANVNANPDDNCPALGGNGGTTVHSNSATGSTPVTGVTALYSDFAITGFSEFWLHGNTFSTPLAIQLADFSANCTDAESIITWSTASEQNSDFFTLERSRDGFNWQVVTTVNGAGTTNTVNSYRVNDNMFGEIYYRLKQTDFDGRSEYFGPIITNCSGKNELIVYPNPNTGQFTVAVYAAEEMGDATISIQDVTGKTIIAQNINVLSGTNTVYFENTSLIHGTYIVSILGKDKSTFTPVKLVVQ